MELLLRTCEDPDRRRVLGRFYGPDRHDLDASRNYLPAYLDRWPLPREIAVVGDPNYPRPELLKLRSYWDNIPSPWLTLTRGVSPTYWISSRSRPLKRGSTQADLAGIIDLSTAEIRPRWGYRKAEPWPEPISPERWLEQMLAPPDLTALRDFGDYVKIVRSVAPEVLPDYVRLARTAPPGSRWRRCLTLLLYSDRTEEAPLLIDDIEQELRDHPLRFGDRNLWPILILRFRFGVNHFWDVAAWRRWWADYQAKAITPSAGAPDRANGPA